MIRPRGFSLIELVVVLVLMAIVASMATLSLRGVVVRQRLSRAAETVEQFDASLRRSARVDRQGSSGLINRSKNRLTVETLKKTFRLPDQVSIESIRTSNGPSTTIDVQGDGSSQTYAVKLSSGGASRWVLLVGGSGQVVHNADGQFIDMLINGPGE